MRGQRSSGGECCTCIALTQHWSRVSPCQPIRDGRSAACRWVWLAHACDFHIGTPHCNTSHTDMNHLSQEHRCYMYSLNFQLSTRSIGVPWP